MRKGEDDVGYGKWMWVPTQQVPKVEELFAQADRHLPPDLREVLRATFTFAVAIDHSSFTDEADAKAYYAQLLKEQLTMLLLDPEVRYRVQNWPNRDTALPKTLENSSSEEDAI